jgi:hypothetical protein
LLALRPALALGGQCALALILWASGTPDPWRRAADAWLATFAIGECLNLWILLHLARREGRSVRALYQVGGRATLRGDLLWLVLALVVSGPLVMAPNLLIADLLWGDPQGPADLIFRPLPLPVAVAILIGFPVVHALTELPTYFGTVMPRLRGTLGSPGALAVTALVLSLQHAFLPLLFDVRYLAWRALMFLPFALWMGFVVHRRPTLLPFLVAAHYLLDLSLPLLVLQASVAT